MEENTNPPATIKWTLAYLKNKSPKVRSAYILAFLKHSMRRFERASHDAHYTMNLVPFSRTIDTLNLEGCTVVDIGLGGGAISELAIKAGASKIIAYEIDSERPEVKEFLEKHGDKIELRTMDFRNDDLTYWNNDKTVIIANPPYILLEDIANLIDEHKPAGALLMTSQHRYRYFQDYKIVARQWGKDFVPTAYGDHYLAIKGFEGRRKGLPLLPPENTYSATPHDRQRGV